MHESNNAHSMLVSAIVAVAQNHVIGDGADIPWRLSGDLKFFKKTTTGHCVIMGRKTFDSMGRPLPSRTNIVLTRDPFFAATGVLVARTVQEALDLAYEAGDPEAFIIGGGEIYRQSQLFWDKLYLTQVHCDAPGSVYFPELDWTDWVLQSEETHQADDRNEYDYTIKILARRQR